MLKIIFALVVLLALAVLPVMYTARAVGAQRTGVWWVLAALFVQGVFSKLIDSVVPSALLLVVLSVLAGAFAYQFVLETNYKKGLIISLVSGVVFVVGAFLLTVSLGGTVNVRA